MTSKLHRSSEATIAGRLRKAEQFMEGAETIRELADDEHDDTRRLQSRAGRRS